MYLEREKRLLVLFVHLIWFTLILWVCGLFYCGPPLLTHGHLSYLVLVLLLCVYPCHDDSHLMGFFGTLFFWLDNLLYYFIINAYFMVLLIKTFGPFYTL